MVFQKVIHKSAQSETDDELKTLVLREGIFADVGCSNLESVELVVAAAHKLILPLTADIPKEIPAAFRYTRESTSSLLVLMPTESANFSHA